MFKVNYSGRTDQTRYFNEVNETLTAADVRIGSTWCETFKVVVCLQLAFCVNVHKNIISGFEAPRLH